MTENDQNRDEDMERIDQLVRAAQPEFARVERVTEFGLASRLRSSLGDQGPPLAIAIDTAINIGLRFAIGVTALVVLQSGVWFLSSGVLAGGSNRWAVEKWLLGI